MYCEYSNRRQEFCKKPFELVGGETAITLSGLQRRKLLRWMHAAHNFAALRINVGNLKTGGLENWLDLCIELDRYWAEAVIFAALCLEAFVFDYASTHFTTGFAKDYLDGYDLKAKWVVIPRLVTGKDFPRNTEAFQHLGDLIRERNNLVHHKSQPMANFGQVLREMVEAVHANKGLPEDKAELDPYQTIIDVLTELKKLDVGTVDTDWWELEGA